MAAISSGCATYISAECEFYEPITMTQETWAIMTDAEKRQVDYNNLMFDEVCK